MAEKNVEKMKVAGQVGVIFSHLKLTTKKVYQPSNQTMVSHQTKKCRFN
jgi:hypothetical protein